MVQKWLQVARNGSKGSEKWFQGVRKLFKVGPKMVPRGPKMVPRGPKNGSKGSKKWSYRKTRTPRVVTTIRTYDWNQACIL